MLKTITKIEAFMRSRDGATAIEYGLIAAGIAVAISAIVFTFGEQLAGMFSDTATAIEERKVIE
jgi:pilus assembly protein Flp/PilA